MSDVALLAQLQQRVADREPIDWAALEPDLRRSDSLSPDDLAELALLRLLDEIGAAHTTLQSGELEMWEPAAPELRADSVDDDETLATWGRYKLEAQNRPTAFLKNLPLSGCVWLCDALSRRSHVNSYVCYVK